MYNYTELAKMIRKAKKVYVWVILFGINGDWMRVPKSRVLKAARNSAENGGPRMFHAHTSPSGYGGSTILWINS